MKAVRVFPDGFFCLLMLPRFIRFPFAFAGSARLSLGLYLMTCNLA